MKQRTRQVLCALLTGILIWSQLPLSPAFASDTVVGQATQSVDSPVISSNEYSDDSEEPTPSEDPPSEDPPAENTPAEFTPAGDTVETGTTGTVTWELNLETGVMTLSGEGATANYKSGTDKAKSAPWFDWMDDIKTIAVENGVTSLGERLFYGADNLVSVSLPESLKSVAEGVFRSCTKLETIAIPNSVTELARANFYQCKNLKLVSIGSGITVIRDITFSKCAALEEVTFVGDNISFEKDAFAECNNLTKINFGGEITQWKALLSGDNTDLLKSTAITVHCTDGDYVFGSEDPPSDDKVKSGTCGENVAWELTGEDNNYCLTITATNEKNKIDNYSVGGTPWNEYLTQITSLVVEDGVKSLGDRLLYGATALQNISIPSSVTATGNGTFRGCTSLVTAEIPGAITTMADNLFYQCTALEQVTFGEGTTLVGKNAFNGCTVLQDITLPATITTIEKEAFRACSSLKSITIPNGVTTIGEGAFRACAKLESVDIPDSVTTLTRVAFFDCPVLDTVIIGKGITTIHDKQFSGCTALTTIHLAADTVTFEVNSLYNCNSLTEIRFGGTIAQWKEVLQKPSSADVPQLFSTDITVVCADGSYVYGQTKFGTELVFSVLNGILTLSGKGTMGDFTSASEVPWAEDAQNIHTLVIKNGVDRLGANALGGCTNLSSVHYMGSAQEWSDFLAKSGDGNGPLQSAELVLGLSGTCGASGAVKWTLSPDEKILTISGSGDMDDYPSSKVTPWRYSLGEIRSFQVENGVTSVGDFSLRYAIKLNTIEVADSVKRLGNYCFGGCVSLKEVSLPEGVQIIGAKAFSACSSLHTIHLPLTLTHIDMKAFDYDARLSDVYYAGNQNQWNRVIISDDALGNKYLHAATFHYGTPVEDASNFTDISAGSWYLPAVQYMVDHAYMKGAGSRFGAMDKMTCAEALSILHRLAGGQYLTSEEWAQENGISLAGQHMTAASLALLLYQTADYNGYDLASSSAPLDGLTNTGSLSSSHLEALRWAVENSYLAGLLAHMAPVDATRALTRGEAADVLASYLKSGYSQADRYDRIIHIVKTALQAGGDGQLYILGPDLMVPDLTTKPGDCTLIVFPDGKTMMIDSGVSQCQTQVIKLLQDLNLTSLDYFMLSHPHSDHVGGALPMAKYLDSVGGKVGTYYYTGYIDGTTETDLRNYLREKGTDLIVNVKAGDQWNIGDVGVKVFCPTAEELLETGSGDEFVNNLSIAMKLTYGDSTYLTCGDIYASMEQKLVAKYGAELQADVMKSNHHGLYTSNLPIWIETVSPSIVLTYSDDIGNAALSNMLKHAGASYYSVGMDGLIMVSMDNQKNYTKLSQRDSSLRQIYPGYVNPGANSYTISVSTNSAVGGTVFGSGTFSEDTFHTVMASANPGYRFTGWTEHGTQVSSSASYSFTITGHRTLVANFERIGNPSDSNRSSSDDSGDTTPSEQPSLPKESWVESDLSFLNSQGTAGNGVGHVRTRNNGIYGIRAKVFSQLQQSLAYEHDTVKDNAVQVRLYIKEPAKILEDIYVSGWVTGSEVEKARDIFEKWFQNKVRVIHMDHTKPWGQRVEIAAKVDLAKIDVNNLYFYSYDKKSSRYSMIRKPNSWVDANGYLHFYTDMAADIVISEGPLVKR